MAAFLAGANCMRWRQFLIFNAAGGIVWAVVYGVGAYYLAQAVDRLAKPVGIGIGVAAVIVVIASAIFLRRHEAELEDKAEKALPGPLRPFRKKTKPN